MVYAFVGYKKIKNMAGLVAAEKHAKRQDNSKHINKTLTHLNPALGYPGVSDPLAIVEAFKARKKDAGASERKGASLAIHMLLCVSPEWIAETGDVHDPANPRNVALFDSAKQFMEDKFGAGSVIHVRLDVDEAGAGVVDVIAVPVTEYTQRGKLKKQVSANAGLEAAFGKGGDFRRLQSDWSAHCKATLDSKIERGRPKEETGREHVHHTVFRSEAEAVLGNAKKQAREIISTAKTEAIKEWGSARDLPWRDREKIVQAAHEAGKAEGISEVRKKAAVVIAREAKKAVVAQAEALAVRDKEWSEKVAAAENESARLRLNLASLGAENETLADENARLRNEVSVLKVALKRASDLLVTIAKAAPEPIKRAIALFFKPEPKPSVQPEPEPLRGSAQSRADSFHP